ncbi:MAG: hypothetical protein KA712_07410 [Myxococcales bacterium]|nr:hypothetical protein [Myxococcales bacterium]
MNFKLRSTLWTLLVVMGGCADFERGDDAPLPEAPAAPDAAATEGGRAAASFETDILPLLTEGCAGCHSSGGQAANTTLLYTGTASADLAASLPYVNQNDPTASRLVTKALGRGHGGGMVWASGSTEVSLVVAWIQEGAKP